MSAVTAFECIVEQKNFIKRWLCSRIGVEDESIEAQFTDYGRVIAHEAIDGRDLIRRLEDWVERRLWDSANVIPPEIPSGE